MAVPLCLFITASCNSLRQVRGDLNGTEYVFQGTLSENAYNKGSIVFKDDLFTLKLEKYGSDVEYQYQRILGTYEQKDDAALLLPFKCANLLEVHVSKDSLDEYTRLSIRFKDQYGREYDEYSTSDTLNFSDLFGNLSYRVDNQEWRLIEVKDFKYVFRTNEIIGDTLQFRLGYSNSLIGTNHSKDSLFYSDLFKVNDLSQKKIVILYNWYQNGCIDDISLSGEIRNGGIKMQFEGIEGFDGIYQRMSP
ncbi:hypothetical protein [Owenweeksia hongkongensis]|uniref:hypothetical protein n=1 Tax=Owenweeksia hongkongensis TaxID=253245 RepID=UPI003A950EEC